MTTAEKREDIKAEYEAEFLEGGESTALAVRPEELAQEITTILGPSTRQQVTKLTLAFKTKVGELEAEIAEMAEREAALKETARTTAQQNHRLAAERDEWRAKVDPAGEISQLREELGKSNALHSGWQKMVGEHKARVDDLVSQVTKGNDARRILADQVRDLQDRLREAQAEITKLKARKRKTPKKKTKAKR